MSRKAIFDTCNRKNRDIEIHLSGLTGEKQITRGKNYTYSEFSKILNMPMPNDILLLKLTGAPHSVILVKNKFLKEGFGIFDPNGYTVRLETTNELETKFYFMLLADKGDDRDIHTYTEDIFDSISPTRPLNRGNDTVNPGYCGIFGIIFMTYFRHAKTIKNWHVPWSSFIDKIWAPFYRDPKSDSPALLLASDVQLIIRSPSNMKNAELQILEKINEYFIKHGIKFPVGSLKRPRSEFGKEKYNNRSYVVHVGPRGGRYINVKGTKKYI